MDGIKKILESDIFHEIEWIVVSLGDKGSLAKHNDVFYMVSIPKVNVKNPVGSGDSTVAGLAYGVSKNMNDIALLTVANAFGILNAMEEETGKINLNNLNRICSKIVVTNL